MLLTIYCHKGLANSELMESTNCVTMVSVELAPSPWPSNWNSRLWNSCANPTKNTVSLCSLITIEVITCIFVWDIRQVSRIWFMYKLSSQVEKRTNIVQTMTRMPIHFETAFKI